MSLDDAEGGNEQVKLLKTSNTCINDVLFDDLLVEILHRLPAKWAAQCKLVCKRWLSIVSSSYFLRCIIMFRCITMCNDNEEGEKLRAICGGNQMLMASKKPGSKLSLDFLPCFAQGQDPEDFKIVGCSFGLLLCCIGQFYPSIYYVCNPFTEKWVELPSPPGSCEIVQIGFIRDPWYHVDERNNVVINPDCGFKVVHVANSSEVIFELVVEIFSSKTRQWTKHIVSFPQGYTSTDCHPILFFNTKMYWLAQQGVVIYDPNHKRIHGVVTDPTDEVQEEGVKCLRQCSGSLWLHQQIYWDIYIWQAECEDNNLINWSSRRWVNLLDLRWSNLQDLRSYPYLLVVHHDDPDILYFWCVTSGNPFIASCDMRTQTLEFVCEWSDGN
ncbi:hypothetical protein Ancab_009982 [Ancistrocladus abbreviatus]